MATARGGDLPPGRRSAHRWRRGWAAAAKSSLDGGLVGAEPAIEVERHHEADRAEESGTGDHHRRGYEDDRPQQRREHALANPHRGPPPPPASGTPMRQHEPAEREHRGCDPGDDQNGASKEICPPAMPPSAGPPIPPMLLAASAKPIASPCAQAGRGRRRRSGRRPSSRLSRCPARRGRRAARRAATPSRRSKGEPTPVRTRPVSSSAAPDPVGEAPGRGSR